MIDWYFAGMFEESFWAMVGDNEIKGRTADGVLRPLVAIAVELDFSWISKVRLLDALCRSELAFAIERKGEQIRWVLNPFRDPPEASGGAEMIGDAIDALLATVRIRYGEQWARRGPSLS